MSGTFSSQRLESDHFVLEMYKLSAATGRVFLARTATCRLSLMQCMYATITKHSFVDVIMLWM